VAEFRKREDITQEIDILQTWSEMGAPRMGDLGPNLTALMKSVDPELIRQVEGGPILRRRNDFVTGPPRDGGEPPNLPPNLPPLADSPFANLPPGDDEERVSRPIVLPVLGLLLLGFGSMNRSPMPIGPWRKVINQVPGNARALVRSPIRRPQSLKGPATDQALRLRSSRASHPVQNCHRYLQFFRLARDPVVNFQRLPGKQSPRQQNAVSLY
jgi:hypothetical protein